MENSILRKKLGIPDDEVIPTNSILAKQKKIEKLNERLTLKLRASEEMRLQLKLEKNDLKRKISTLSRNDNLQSIESTVEYKNCDKCLAQYDLNASLRNCKSCEFRRNLSYCNLCVQSLNINEDNSKITEIETKYSSVIEENENLRIGMHEILQKLREYDATSNSINIDTTTLEKLLHALDARSVSGWYHPAMRLQNELLVSKERELQLKERIKSNESLLKSKQIILGKIFLNILV